MIDSCLFIIVFIMSNCFFINTSQSESFTFTTSLIAPHLTCIWHASNYVNLRHIFTGLGFSRDIAERYIAKFPWETVKITCQGDSWIISPLVSGRGGRTWHPSMKRLHALFEIALLTATEESCKSLSRSSQHRCGGQGAESWTDGQAGRHPSRQKDRHSGRLAGKSTDR